MSVAGTEEGKGGVHVASAAEVDAAGAATVAAGGLVDGVEGVVAGKVARESGVDVGVGGKPGGGAGGAGGSVMDIDVGGDTDYIDVFRS